MLGIREILILAALIAGLILWVYYRRRIERRGRDEKTDTTESFRRCPVCGTYVSAEAAPLCERPDCPYER